MFKSRANINNGITHKNSLCCFILLIQKKMCGKKVNSISDIHGEVLLIPKYVNLSSHLLQKNNNQNAKKGFVMWSRAINGLKIMMYTFHSWIFCFSKINCFSDISVIMYPSNFPIAKKSTNNPLLFCEGYGSAILWNFSEYTAASGRGWS